MSSVGATNAEAGMQDVVGVPRLRLDVKRERALTQGAELSRHFNAAGSALPSVGVITAVIDHLRLEEARGGYEAAAHVRDRIDNVYNDAAELIGAQASEIALFDSASTGLRVIIDALRPAAGDRIVASTSTYVSHALHLMTLARERDVELVIAPVDAHRRVDVEALQSLLTDGRPTILSVAHVPTSSGLVEPVALIGDVARRYGATYILDATQSTGHLKANVGEIGCDALATTGRKFLRGPRGTGFAYVSSELGKRLLPLSPDVRGAQWTAPHDWELTSSARRFESWESAIAARLGLGAAIREALDRGIDETEAWLCAISDELRAELSVIPGVAIADPDGAVSAIVTFTVHGVSSHDVVQSLVERNVRVVSVPATHGQWDLGARGLTSVVRASPHVYNDEADLSALLDGVAAIASASRNGGH